MEKIMDSNEIDQLEYILETARDQLKRSEDKCRNKQQAILEAKKEQRENTVHQMGNLFSSDGFEELVELSQYAHQISLQLDDYEMEERKVGRLEKIIKAPYFARIDFKFQGETVPEPVYIGRFTLTGDKDYDIKVFDWRSPISSVFYRYGMGQAEYSSPSGTICGEISLKRQYEIKNSVLEYYFDSEMEIVDEFLKRLLAQNASKSMRAIVETIQRDQDVVIRDMTSDLMMVQGVAGSGKTSVALHRAAYLMYQGLSGKLLANNILIISPNSLFEQYISRVLPELGEENVVSYLFEDIIENCIHVKKLQSYREFLELSAEARGEGGKEIRGEGGKEIRGEGREEVGKEARGEGREEVGKEAKGEGGKEIRGEGREEVGKEAGGEIEKEAREEVREEIREEAEIMRDSFAYKTSPEFIRIMKEYAGRNKKVKGGKELYLRLLNEPRNKGSIFQYSRKNMSKRTLLYEDALCICFLHLLQTGAGEECRAIKQVIIDEVQDYTPLHFEILKILYPQASYTTLGDINQSISRKVQMDFYDQIKEILNRPKSLLVNMNKSFRCSRQILEFSAGFLDDPASVESFCRDGDQPEVHSAQTTAELDTLIVKEVETCLERGYESVALICENQKAADQLQRRLQGRLPGKTDILAVRDDNNEGPLSRVFTIPLYMAKGLEFDGVLIVDITDRQHLYIASTRALHRLTVFQLEDA